jgi:hypothetical protein
MAMSLPLLSCLRIAGGVAYSGCSFTSRYGTLYDVARCEEGVDRAGPEEE